jgi:hypothetical protein
MGAEGFARVYRWDGLRLLVADRTHVIVQGLEVREQLVDLSALIAFLECDVCGLEQFTLFDVFLGPLQADIRDTVITKTAPTDIYPNMLADLYSCQLGPCLFWLYLFRSLRVFNRYEIIISKRYST